MGLSKVVSGSGRNHHLVWEGSIMSVRWSCEQAEYRMGNIAKVCVLVSSLVACVSVFASATSYKYDALGRVSEVTDGAATIRYYYDAAGNRTQKQTQGGTATTIAMPSSNAVERGGSVVLTVTIGGTSPSGWVSFYEGSTFLGSAQVTNGTATVELIGLTLGSHNITVSYSGDVAHGANSVSIPIKVVNLDWLPAVLEILMN
jgi:YD repeat-containing protein